MKKKMLMGLRFQQKVITLDVDLEKASADDLATYDLEDLADETATYEELKEQLEESGYTCK